MKKQTNFFQQIGIALALSISSVAMAGSIATEQLDSGGLTLLPNIPYDEAALRVSSDNTDTTTSYTAGDTLRINSGGLADGTYYYELLLSNDSSADIPGSSADQNGSFIVSNGIASSNSVEAAMQAAEAEKSQAIATSFNAAASQVEDLGEK